MTTSADDYEDENQEPVQSTSFSQVPFSLPSGEKTKTLPPGDRALVNAAQTQAVDDADSIRILSESGKFVRINRERVYGKTRKLAREHITSNPNAEEYKRLVSLYQQSYENQLSEEVANNPDLQYINDAQEARLRGIAIQDKNDAPPQHIRDYHIRDLAVIRVLQLTSTPLDAATDHLSRLHFLADRYQEYYSNLREEEDWPRPEDFRN